MSALNARIPNCSGGIPVVPNCCVLERAMEYGVAFQWIAVPFDQAVGIEDSGAAGLQMYGCGLNFPWD
jgi:hypothetical protein